MCSQKEFSLQTYLVWTIQLIMVTFFWGTTFVLVKDALNFLTPIEFLALRFNLAFFISLITLRLLYEQSWKLLLFNQKGWILGIVLYLAFLFQTIGLNLTTPGNAAFVTSLYVPFVPVIMILFLKKDLRKIVFFWAFLAVIGLAFMTLNFATMTINTGDLIILLTAILLAIHIIYTSEFASNTSEGSLVISQFFAMACLSIPILVIIEVMIPYSTGQSIGQIFIVNFGVILALVVTVIFATLYAFYVQTAAQKRKLPAEYVALVFAFEPVFALLTSLSVGAEILTIEKAIGAIIMFIAILGTIFTQGKRIEHY
jgi:drug/metabolite transporter (DMT)-like permease